MAKLTDAPYVNYANRDIDAHPIFVGAGTLNSLRVFNGTAGTLYLLLFDSAAAPAAESEPDIPPIPLTAGEHRLEVAPFGFALGCWACFSSTATPLTYAGTAGALADACVAATGERH